MATARKRAGLIEWRLKGFEEIRREPGVNRALEEEVTKVLNRVKADGLGDDDYDGGVSAGRTRSRGHVVTTSIAAMQRESDTKALLRAVG